MAITPGTRDARDPARARPQVGCSNGRVVSFGAGLALPDRRTGRIVIVRLPNMPLLVWFGMSVVRWLLNPPGRWGTVLEVTATAALVVWAGDEIVRGANPSRRILGSTDSASWLSRGRWRP
jgi:hypothetical protein